MFILAYYFYVLTGVATGALLRRPGGKHGSGQISELISFREHQNYCVNAEQTDLTQTPIAEGQGSKQACQSLCHDQEECSGFEWYEKKWKGYKCFLVTSGIAAAGAKGPQWKDARCFVKVKSEDSPAEAPAAVHRKQPHSDGFAARNFNVAESVFRDAAFLQEVQHAHKEARGKVPSTARPLAICTRVRNEERYLEEWVVFHRKQGVQAFFILNDHSTDRSGELLKLGKDLGVTILGPEIIQNEDYEAVDPKVFLQAGVDDQVVFLNACNRYASANLKSNPWVINIDVDEFLMPSNSTGPSLSQVFYDMEQRGVTYMNVQRILVGSNGHLVPDGGPVTSRFQHRMLLSRVQEHCAFEGGPAFGTREWKLCQNYQDSTYGKFAALSNSLIGVHTPHKASTARGLAVECGEEAATCGLVIYHYQLKSLTEFLSRVEVSSWKSKYGQDPESWFKTFNEFGNDAFDNKPAMLLGAWPTRPPPSDLPPSPKLQNRSAVTSIYGEDMARELFEESSILKATENYTAPVGVLLLGMHHTGTSIATRLLLSLGLWGGEPDDFELPEGNPLKFWERKDVVAMDQTLLDGQATAGVASWTGLDFMLEKASTSEVETWFDSAPAVLASLIRGRRPFVTKDPRMALVLPLWRDVMQGRARPVCALMWRSMEQNVNAMATHDICTGERIKGRCQGGISQEDMVNLASRYFNDAVDGCQGVPTVIMKHSDVRDAASFLRDSSAKLKAAVPDIQLSTPELAMELTKDLMHDSFNESYFTAEELALGMTWRDINTLATEAVMTRVTTGQKGPWTDASAEDLARVLRSEIDSQVVDYRNFLARAPMRRDAFGRREGQPGAALPASALDESRMRQYSGNVWLAWTTAAETFGLLQRIVLESIFRHNPNSKVNICSDSLVEVMASGNFTGETIVLKQLLDMGYEISVYTFPRELLQTFIANSYDPKAEMAYSHLTDLWRYYTLHENGGIYMDFDVVVTNPWINLPEQDFFHYQYDAEVPPPKNSKADLRYNSSNPDTWLLNTAFMKFEKGSPFMGHLLKVAKDYHQPKVWTCIGNEMVIAELPQFRDTLTIVPMITAAPMSWDRVVKCQDPQDADCNSRCSRNFEGGWAFHTYNRAMPGAGHGSFDQASCLGRLMTEHRLDMPEA